MTAPSIAASSSNKVGHTQTGVLVTYSIDGPSGIVADSLLLGFAVSGFGTGTNFDNTAATYAQAVESAMGSGTARNAVTAFSLLAGGSETSETFDATPDSVNNGMCVKVVRITGHRTVGYVHQTAATAGATIASGAYAVSGVTTTVPDCLVFYIVGASGVRTFTQDAGSEQWDFATSTPTNDVSMCGVILTQASPGATGTINFTPNTYSTTCTGICIAIASPAAATNPAQRLPILGVG